MPSRLVRKRVLGREFRDVMVADHIDFIAVIMEQTTEFTQAGTSPFVIVCSLSGEC